MSKVYVLINEKVSEPIITQYHNDPEYFKEMNQKGYGIYRAVNEFEATNEQMQALAIIKKKSSVTKRNTEFLSKLCAVYADLDIGKKGDKMPREEKQRRKQIVTKALKSYCEPSLILDTSNGLQPFWLLNETSIDSETQLKYVNCIKSIIEWSKQYGCTADAVQDVARILRVPRYYHMKEDPYLCEFVHAKEQRFDLDYLISKFPVIEKLEIKKEFVQSNSNDPVIQAINDLDIKEVCIKVAGASGRNATFDNSDRLVLDGRLTGSFASKEINQTMCSTSHEPFVGNAITLTADVLGLTNKESFKWLVKEFKLDRFKEEIKHKAKEIVKEIKIESSDPLDIFYEKQEVNNRTWGVECVDSIFLKPKPKDLIYFLGQPGAGKTTYCFSMAIKNAQQGVKVCYLSLEMDKKDLMEIYIEYSANIGEIERQSIKYTPMQEIIMRRCKKELQNPNFTLLDLNDFKEEFNKEILFETASKYDMIFVDNFGFMCPTTEKEYEAQKEISRSILTYVKANEKCLIMLHHYSGGQTGEKKAEGRGSRKLVDDCFRWVSIAREINQNLDTIDNNEKFSNISFQKNRTGKGKCGKVKIKFKEGHFENGISNQAKEISAQALEIFNN